MTSHSKPQAAPVSIVIEPNVLADVQPYPVVIRADIDKTGYSGLMNLLNNPDLLALNDSGAKLDPKTAGYLQSSLEAAANTLGDAFYALCALYGSGDEAREYITPFLLSDFGLMMGELLPYFTRLSAELATDRAEQSPQP